MSREELLAEILRLPTEKQRALIAEVEVQLGLAGEMTSELRAELERRVQDAMDRPEDEMSWEEACVELDRRKVARSDLRIRRDRI